MGAFLGLSLLWPRSTEQRIISRDLVINVITGGSIFVLAKPLTDWLSTQLQWSFWAPPIESSVLQFLLAFVLLDFTRYWLHYAHHRVPLLWRFHTVHHSSETLDVTSGLRMHVLDFLQLALVPMLLFGVCLDVRGWADWVLPAALSVGVFFDAFQHANLRFDVSKPWNRAWHKIFNNPHFHVWHHTREGAVKDGNYGNSLVIWDRLFGTEVTESTIPPLLGVTAEKSLVNDPLSLQLLRHQYAHAGKD